MLHRFVLPDSNPRIRGPDGRTTNPVVPPSGGDLRLLLTRLVSDQAMRGLTEKMQFSDGCSVADYKHRLLLLDESPSQGKLGVVRRVAGIHRRGTA